MRYSIGAGPVRVYAGHSRRKSDITATKVIGVSLLAIGMLAWYLCLGVWWLAKLAYTGGRKGVTYIQSRFGH